LAVPSVNLLGVGRQVLGEVPALAFLMFGVYFWSGSLARTSHARRDLILATLAFGLTALTKNQFVLILAPTLALLFVVDRLYHRTLRPAQTILPLIAVIAGTGLGQVVPLIPLIGTDQLGQTLALAREASSGAIFVFSPSRMLSSSKLLLSTDSFAYWAL